MLVFNKICKENLNLKLPIKPQQKNKLKLFFFFKICKKKMKIKQPIKTQKNINFSFVTPLLGLFIEIH